MTQYLIFTLYAPLASWGEITVGEDRSSWDRPSRSAVMGLLASALGITREDQDRHDALDLGYGLAIRLDAGGTSLIDFHTTQTTSEIEIKKFFGKDQRPTTRRDFLSPPEQETMLSHRELRQDALASACLWAQPDARWRLEELRDAIRRPVFVLYAGRKANAFGLPADPEVVEAVNLAEAFAHRAPRRPDAVFRAFDQLKSRGAWGREVAHDALPASVESGLMFVRRETRRDRNAQRGRWQFSERVVDVGLLPEETTP